MGRETDLTFPVDPEHNLLSLTDEGSIKRVLTASDSLDFGSISPGISASLTIAVNGAKTGDAVILAPPNGLENPLVGMGFVSASNVVTVRVANNSGSTLDPAARTWGVIVIGLS